jgi:hypothetical protein
VVGKLFDLACDSIGGLEGGRLADPQVVLLGGFVH